ncbi:MAG: hypothetical protein FWG40_11345 [Peptococcaceae bacterium]|nr:hypothetical protein [Peptococcaceae bacterium]
MTKTQWLTDVETNDTTVRLTTPNLNLKVHHLALLKQPTPKYLPCRDILATDTHTTFLYDKGDFYQPFTTRITSFRTLEKYLILLNIGKVLKDEKRTHGLSFDPRNIFITETYNAAFLFKILPNMFGTPYMPETHSSREEFDGYKTLVLSVVQEKHDFAYLSEYGPDILQKNKLCAAIIKATTPEDLETVLTQEYQKVYRDTRTNSVTIKAGRIRLITTAVSILFITLTLALAYFAYTTITETRTYGVKMYLYQAHYNQNPAGVIEQADKLKDSDLDRDPKMKKIIADALIATGEPRNLQRAFPLDLSRQTEIINTLIAQEQYDILTTLTTNDPAAQLRIAYYTKDYRQTVAIAEENLDLQFDAQAQLLAAKAYAVLGDYDQAETILTALGDLDLLLTIYQEQREIIAATETNIERRKQIRQDLDDRIKLIEDIKNNTTK